jgi:hypothetical protein
MEKTKENNGMCVEGYGNLLAVLVFAGVGVYVFYQIAFVHLGL